MGNCSLNNLKNNNNNIHKNIFKYKSFSTDFPEGAFCGESRFCTASGTKGGFAKPSNFTLQNNDVTILDETRKMNNILIINRLLKKIKNKNNCIASSIDIVHRAISMDDLGFSQNRSLQFVLRETQQL
jgi:hypothetical protein